MLNRLFKRQPELPEDPFARLRDAVDEANSAMAALPAGNRLCFWVERRPGQKALLTVSEYTPGEGRQVWPKTDAEQLRGDRS